MNFKGKTYFLFPFNIQFVECIDHMVDGGKTQEKRKRKMAFDYQSGQSLGEIFL